MSGLIADKHGSYGPAFYMAGGTYIVASLIPCVLHCVRTRETTRKDLSTTGNENTGDTLELELRSHHDELRKDEPLKVAHSSNDRKPVELGHYEFVSTV